MSIKFTTTDIDKTKSVKLLFEFLDHEVPEELLIELRTALGKSRFIGSIQSNQVNGVYVEPIVLKGNFYGTYVRQGEVIVGQSNDVNPKGANIITAHERSLELGRLQGRVVKFFFDTIVMDVIIENYKRTYKSFVDVDYELTLQPHDFQEVTKPTGIRQMQEMSVNMIQGNLLTQDDKLPEMTPEEFNEGLNAPPVVDRDKDPNFLPTPLNASNRKTKGQDTGGIIETVKKKAIKVYEDPQGVINFTSKLFTNKGLLLRDYAQETAKGIGKYLKGEQ